MKQHHKSSLFLMELIVGILFFALSSAICIQIFTKAKLMNDESSMKYQAARTAGNIIEIYKEQRLDDYYQRDDQGYIYFDKDWNHTLSNDAPYQAQITINQQTITITMVYQKNILYKIDYMSYQQKTF